MALEISHLVVNGCSFTYCQALYDPPTEGWPKLLADKLGVPVVNLAIPGSSNEGVHRRTYDYFYKNLPNKSKPFFVIAMTQLSRREEYLVENHMGILRDFSIISANDKIPLAKEIYRNMDDKGYCIMQFKKLMQWQSLINLFESHNVPYLTSDYMPDTTGMTKPFIMENYSELYHQVYSNPKRLMDFIEITRKYPKALDHGHDGKEAQVALADYIYKQLVRRYGEIIPVKSDFLSLKNFRTQHKQYFETRNQWYMYEMGIERFYGLN
jgi:hypothetical protein